MGKFITPEEMKIFAQVDRLKWLDSEVLDRLYIQPAEREIEIAFGLSLETSLSPEPEDARDVPTYLRSFFDQNEAEEDKFRTDYRDAVTFMVNRVALNPEAYVSQSVGGASAQFGPRMPQEVSIIMKKWAGRTSNARQGMVVR